MSSLKSVRKNEVKPRRVRAGSRPSAPSREGCEPSPGRLGLPALLDTFEQAAYLLTLKGALIFANAAARQRAQRAPEWVRPYALREPHEQTPHGARRVRLRHAGVEMLLVTAPRERPHEAEFDWSRFKLGPSLAQVANLVAQGFKDKDIVAMTGRPLATVRGYVMRVYKRVGVTSRVELALLVKELKLPASATPRAAGESASVSGTERRRRPLLSSS